MSVARRLTTLAITAGMPLALALGPPVSAHAQGQASRLTRSVADIAALAPDDVWQVGSYYVRQQAKLTLARHWDGQAWATVETANPGKGQNALYAVSGTGADDVWAVGYWWAGPTGKRGPERLLAEHWDGTAWTSVHVEQPNSPGHHHYTQRLGDVAAIAPDDAWAIGGTTQSYGPFVEHWDGSRWSMVRVPGVMESLTAVAGSAADDVWIVGDNNRPLHWDGTSWQVTRGPDLGEGAHDAWLYDVAAASPTNAWAVGSYEDSTGASRPLLMHWDGKAWQLQAPPRAASWGSLSATSATDVWATGTEGDYPAQKSVVAHWDGTRWSTSALPHPLRRARLLAVSADASDDAWVQGVRGYGDDAPDVVGHWDGTRWRLQN